MQRHTHIRTHGAERRVMLAFQVEERGAAFSHNGNRRKIKYLPRKEIVGNVFVWQFKSFSYHNNSV